MSTRSPNQPTLVIDDSAAAETARTILAAEGPLIDVLRGQLLDDEIAHLLNAAVGEFVVTYVALASEATR